MTHGHPAGCPIAIIEHGLGLRRIQGPELRTRQVLYLATSLLLEVRVDPLSACPTLNRNVPQVYSCQLDRRQGSGRTTNVRGTNIAPSVGCLCRNTRRIQAKGHRCDVAIPPSKIQQISASGCSPNCHAFDEHGNPDRLQIQCSRRRALSTAGLPEKVSLTAILLWNYPFHGEYELYTAIRIIAAAVHHDLYACSSEAVGA